MSKTVVETSFLGDCPRRKPRRIHTSAPFRWISEGFRDIRRTPVLSLCCGVLFGVLGSWVLSRLNTAAVSGSSFLGALSLFTPVLASVLFAARRDIEQSANPNVVSALRLVRERFIYIAMCAIMLAALAVGWLRLVLLFTDVGSHTLPNVGAETPSPASGIPASIFLGLFFALTVFLAWLTYIASAIALPLVIDGDADFVTSMITSFQAASLNPLPMLLWAGFVALLVTIGIATSFFAFALIFPLLVYGTWQGYRDLIG